MVVLTEAQRRHGALGKHHPGAGLLCNPMREASTSVLNLQPRDTENMCVCVWGGGGGGWI